MSETIKLSILLIVIAATACNSDTGAESSMDTTSETVLEIKASGEGIYTIREIRDAPPQNLDELREALEFNRRITRFLNIDHRVGEIGVGMDADIVIWEEDPLEAVSVIIDGNHIGRVNR